MINIGLIGYGYWGPNLARNFFESPDFSLATICDVDSGKLELAQKRYPSAKLTSDYNEIFVDKNIDAIVIATPVFTHFKLAMLALQNGKHVLITKPITETSEQAIKLIDEASKRGLILMVDHTFVYTGAVRKIRELVSGGELGDICYFDSARVNLGLFQHDVDVIWDLAVHDISIMDYTLGEVPNAISATGASHVPDEPENVAYLTLFFKGSLIAHINVNWLAPVKVRRILIGGNRKMIVYDDIEPSEKVKVYDKGIAVSNKAEKYKMLISYRAGDMWAPQLDMTEALQTELIHFARCIKNGERAITDGYAGLRAVRMLEAATRSMKERGKPVELDAR